MSDAGGLGDSIGRLRPLVEKAQEASVTLAGRWADEVAEVLVAD